MTMSHSSTPAPSRPRRRRRKANGANAAPSTSTTSSHVATSFADPIGTEADIDVASAVVSAVVPAVAPVADDRGFADLGVPARIVTHLVAAGIDRPFPIQTATLPDALAGRDVLGRGKTGSGKTLAFAIPTVARLADGPRRRPRRPRALVLVPTRELANQVAETMRGVAGSMGLVTAVVYGGVGQGGQVQALERGVDVLVACPGRLEDLIGQGYCSLDAVQVTVLDEADHMADLGFLPAVRRILDRTPSGTQRLLFSATLDRGIDVLVRTYLERPVVHSVDPASSPVPQMTHHVLSVPHDSKGSLVRELAGGLERSLLFTRTKHGAKKVAKQLTASGVPAVELHGNLSQAARERNLSAFADGSVRVLVATDIAARGIHVDDVALVVHVDPPAEHKAYLHRSGRTARAGASGVVVTIMTPEQRNDVRSLMRSAEIKPVITDVEPGHPIVTDLAGPAAPRVTPSAVSTDATTSGRTAGRAPQRQGGAPRNGAPRSGAARSGAARSGAPRPGGRRPTGRGRR